VLDIRLRWDAWSGPDRENLRWRTLVLLGGKVNMMETVRAPGWVRPDRRPKPDAELAPEAQPHRGGAGKRSSSHPPRFFKPSVRQMSF
jgi:hypothetical protein